MQLQDNSDKIWLGKYIDLNNSFNKRIIFKLGLAGFFSEYTNMILASIYCLDHQVKFEICTLRSAFYFEYGWQDFFEPIWDERFEKYHINFNKRPYLLSQDFKPPFDFSPWVIKERAKRFYYSYFAKSKKKRANIDYFTQDIWFNFRTESFQKKLFTIPELGFDKSTLLDVTQKFISETWIYKREVRNKINKLISSLELPEHFISVHIRSGDKIIETELYSIGHYMRAVQKYSAELPVFVLTDDYGIIKQLRGFYPHRKFYTLCQETERGYINDDFKLMSADYKFNQLLKLFASLDVCAKAQKFIGTITSAPGKMMGMKKGNEFCHYLDSYGWGIY